MPKLNPFSRSVSPLVKDNAVMPKWSPSSLFVSPLSQADATTQARILKALADPTRLSILSLLSQHGGDVCVYEIADCFPLEQPTISHHLSNLRAAGLITCQKKGLFAYYSIHQRTLTLVCQFLHGLTAVRTEEDDEACL